MRFRDPEYFGRRLAEARETKGLSLRQVARLTGLPHCTISAIEKRGAGNFRQALKIAHALGLELELIKTEIGDDNV